MRQSQEESCDYGSSDEDFLGLEGTVGYPSAKLRKVRAIFLGTHRRRRSVLPSQGNQPRVVVSTTTCRNPKATYTDLTSSEDEDAACDRLVDDQDVGLCTTRLKKLCAKTVAPLDLHQLTEKNDHQVSLEDLRDLKQVEEAALTAKVLQLQMRMAKQLAALEASFRSNVAEMTRQLVTAIESERAQSYARAVASSAVKGADSMPRESGNSHASSHRVHHDGAVSSVAKLEATVSQGLLTRVKMPPQDTKPYARQRSHTNENWPDAPLSPRRAQPTTWKKGLSREVTHSKTHQDNSSSRFLSPSEKEELFRLRNTLGRMTEWMDDAVE